MSEPTSTYRLRLEGVNLTNFVSDVQDLSTVRGGGLLMLDIPRRVEAIANRLGIEIRPISKGASSGLFSFECNETAAKRLRDAIAAEFNNDPGLRHATIVLDLLRASNDFIHDREALIALNRWSQMASPSLAVPSQSAASRSCELDLVRPAGSRKMAGSKSVSDSVAGRRAYGQEQKNEFYLNEIQRERTASREAIEVAKKHFVHDLSELTSDHAKKNLHSKMAVIYFDGNRFGDIQNRNCRAENDQIAFDKAIRGYRTEVLDRLLESMWNDPGWILSDNELKSLLESKERLEKGPRHKKAGPYRLETLLWGGDELIWVVPAWQAWRVAQLFYKESALWEFRGAPLTHAGGIVFCHSKAPIHRVRQLAENLAGKAKAVAKRAPESDRARRNVFAYQILESFDHIGRDLDDFRKTRIPAGASVDELVLSGAAMAGIDSAFVKLKSVFPRSKLHEIVRGLQSQKTKPETLKLIDATVDEAFPPNETRDDYESIRKYFGPGETAWFHIAELWDYILPPRTSGAEVIR